MNIAELKTELETDPLGMGYILTETEHNLVLLNKRGKNLGGETEKKTLTVKILNKHLDLAEFSALSADYKEYILAIAGKPEGEEIPRIKSKIKDIFGSGSLTFTGIQSEVRNLSRAEVLWGEGVTVTKKQLREALENG